MKLIVWVGLLVGLNVGLWAEDGILDTNLGDTGNARVRAEFEKYKKTQRGCQGGGSGKRILVTGFGRWLGSDFNISGEVARSFIDPNFWPAEINLDTVNEPKKSLVSTPATLHGAWVGQRSLRVNETPFEVCALYLDVTWDLAAAIIVREMDQFKPDAVFMSGRGFSDAVFEGGVSNVALGMSGYDGLGKELGKLNVPWCNDRPCASYETTSVLPENQTGVEPVISFSWDNRRLAEVSGKYMDRVFSGSVLTPQRPSENNTYLCNNVGYIAAHAAKGIPISLAGGSVVVSATLAQPPTAGFFHYPGSISSDSTTVFQWAKVVASLWKDI